MTLIQLLVAGAQAGPVTHPYTSLYGGVSSRGISKEDTAKIGTVGKGAVKSLQHNFGVVCAGPEGDTPVLYAAYISINGPRPGLASLRSESPPGVWAGLVAGRMSNKRICSFR